MSMQFTPRRTLGGRAWISLRLPKVEYEKALTLWANTSLGLLLYWWHANKQQSGRGSIGVNAVGSLCVLDVTRLTKIQLAKTESLFENLKHEELLPAYLMHEDPVRCNLDKRFLHGVLKLREDLFDADGAAEILRNKLASEPSIRGNK